MSTVFVGDITKASFDDVKKHAEYLIQQPARLQDFETNLEYLTKLLTYQTDYRNIAPDQTKKNIALIKYILLDISSKMDSKNFHASKIAIADKNRDLFYLTNDELKVIEEGIKKPETLTVNTVEIKQGSEAESIKKIQAELNKEISDIDRSVQDNITQLKSHLNDKEGYGGNADVRQKLRDTIALLEEFRKKLKEEISSLTEAQLKQGGPEIIKTMRDYFYFLDGYGLKHVIKESLDWFDKVRTRTPNFITGNYKYKNEFMSLKGPLESYLGLVPGMLKRLSFGEPEILEVPKNEKRGGESELEHDEVPEPVRRMREVEDDEEIAPVFRMREVDEEQPSVETKADHDTPVIEVSVTPSVKQPSPEQQQPSGSSLNVQLLRNAGDALGAHKDSADGMPQSPPRSPEKQQPIPPMPLLSRQASASQQMAMAIQHPIIGIGKVTNAEKFRANNQELVSALTDRTKLSAERKELYENVAIKIADDKNGVQLTIPNASDQTKPNVLTRSFTGDVGTVRLTNPPPPGDKACFVFVDTNRDLAPLVIKTPNGAENLLKVYEASKRGGVEIKFEGEALEQVQNDERYKFLASLKGPSLEAFKKDVSDNPRALGEPISQQLQGKIEQVQQQEAEPVILRGTSPKKS